MPVQSFPHIVTCEVQPQVKVYRSTVQAIPASTDTLVAFNEVYAPYIDVGGLWDIGDPTKIALATQSQAGLYLVIAHLGFAAGSATYRRLNLLFNGAVFARASSIAGAGECFLQCCAIQWLDLGYFVEMEAYQETAGALDTVVGFATELSVVKLW